MTHISNRDLMFQPLSLNDINVIELLIEYRYKYDDNLFLGGSSVFDVTGVKAVNQEVVATYASLEMLIKECKINDQQRKMLKLVEQGYTHREIADEIGIEFQNVSKALQTIYKAIVKENEWQWRKYIYIDKLGLKKKQCSKCKDYLPATNEFFSDNSVSPDMLYSICKKCRK